MYNNNAGACGPPTMHADHLWHSLLAYRLTATIIARIENDGGNESAVIDTTSLLVRIDCVV